MVDNQAVLSFSEPHHGGSSFVWREEKMRVPDRFGASGGDRVAVLVSSSGLRPGLGLIPVVSGAPDAVA